MANTTQLASELFRNKYTWISNIYHYLELSDQLPSHLLLAAGIDASLIWHLQRKQALLSIGKLPLNVSKFILCICQHFNEVVSFKVLIKI